MEPFTFASSSELDLKLAVKVWVVLPRLAPQSTLYETDIPQDTP